MRISDWSSDVCSSDLVALPQGRAADDQRMADAPGVEIGAEVDLVIGGFIGDEALVAATADRQVIADRDGERLAGGGRADALRASTAGIGIEADRKSTRLNSSH